MKKLIPILVFSALVLAAPSLLAEGFKDGPNLAVPFGADVNSPQLSPGWQVAYEFNPQSSLELSVNWQQDETSLSDIGFGSQPDEDEFEFDLWAIALTGRYGVPISEKGRLYFGAGVGYYVFIEDSGAARESIRETPVIGSAGRVVDLSLQLENGFGFQAAVGAEYQFSEAWETFVECRFVSLSTDAEVTVVQNVPDSASDVNLVTGKETMGFDYNYALLRVGFNYRF